MNMMLSLTVSVALMFSATIGTAQQRRSVPPQVYVLAVDAMREKGQPVVIVPERGGDTLVARNIASIVGAKTQRASACARRDRACLMPIRGDTVGMRLRVGELSDTAAVVTVDTWQWLPGDGPKGGRLFHTQWDVHLARRQGQWRVTKQVPSLTS